MNKLKLLLSFDINTKILLLEAFIFLAWARILKIMPFSKVSFSLGEQMEETSFDRIPMNEKKIKSVAQSIQIVSRYTLWESKCLVRAIAAMKMLERRKIESTLYLGTGRDEYGRLAAHAWLRSGPFYITGADGMERYSIVGKFAKRFSTGKIEGEGNG
ncbi:lasso peptide biosynthesis B2 protein [Mesobacillus foraminis]|uniref:lasso peptide biosynthesis B2 protein n=1 Tax=Mesobacillus foraminis TaxID=279826 RepID=UPI00399F6A5D